MRAALISLPGWLIALCCTGGAYAQVSEAAGKAATIDTGTAISFGLLLSVGTIIAGAVSCWFAVRVQMARLEERTSSMCHTLDRHERAIDELQRHRDRGGQ